MSKRNVKIRGSLRTYIYWPFIFIIFLLIMSATIAAVNLKAGLIAVAFTVVYSVAALVIYFIKRPKIVSGLVNFAAEYNKLQRRLSMEMMVPHAILDPDGRLLWYNNEFEEILGMQNAPRQPIFQFFDGIDAGILPTAEQDTNIHIVHEGRNYLASFRRIKAATSHDDVYWIYGDAEQGNESIGDLITMYLMDETDIMTVRKELSDHKAVFGLIYIDNYEEVLESVDEVRRPLLTALVDRNISKSMQQMDAVIKKLEKDKYICIFPNKYLAGLRQNRFPVLDSVRSVNIGNEIPVTISIGLSAETGSFDKAYEQARAAIDLALGRGGDQVVLREGENNIYYGGKSMSVEKNTRVKARVKAHALRELIESKDEIFVMGHSIGDVDSLGAAIGVYRIAKTLDTKAHIVINEITTSVRPMMSRFLGSTEYEDDLFINSEEAKSKISKDSLLVIVDVNRSNYCECPELVEMVESCVIIDHHRMNGEITSNAVLSYIEPYASSACEMVAEILQYSGDAVKLKPLEADAMYAGMMVDTSNFITKTGVRTFEAAAFLRKSGADVTRIRKMFRSERSEYSIRAAAIANSEVYKDDFVFARLGKVNVESPTVLAAQIANELMDIAGVKASFVCSEYNNKIYISARSIDEYNVQVAMEKLGGGGHMSVAGAQLSDCTMDEAIERIKAVLDEKEGEI